MPRATRSAGLLMYRRRGAEFQVLLVHPGGPYWRKKDDGAWSIPKGLHDAAEDAFSAATREFEEETGCRPTGEFVALGEFRQPGGKLISVWAFDGDFDLTLFRSNFFVLEWPPRSGQQQQFPEADRAGWFSFEQAARKLLEGQRPILDALAARLAAGASGAGRT